MASNYSVFDADGQALRMGLHRMALSLARGGGLVQRGDHRPDLDWRKRIFENCGNALI